MTGKTLHTVALVAACGLVIAFVVSFTLGIRRENAPITRVADDRNVPGIASGRRVEVLNAAGRAGLARTATEWLRNAGFDVVNFGNTRPSDENSSVVIDRVGKPQIARAVATRLRISRVETRLDSTRLVEVTVILGADWPPGDSNRQR